MKIIKRVVLVIIVLILAVAVYVGWQAFPILSGYGAKITCSCVMLTGRPVDDVVKNELGSFPLSLGSYHFDYRDSSASASVFGLAGRKAIFRKGLGCTLVVESEENDIRDQEIALPRAPEFDPDTVVWPMGNQIAAALAEFDTEKLGAAIEDAFSEPGEEKHRRTRAILVVYKGQIIAERYAPGFGMDSRFNGWSMSKSITNALVGILAMQSKLKVEESAPVHSWKNDPRRNITLNHLMQASSGLEWKEVYAGPSPATNMLFRKKDAGLFAAEFDLENDPGSEFYYSSGTTNIISRIIREKVGDEYYYRFPYEELFYRVGMVSTILEPDAGGTFVGSSFAFATARDWARFGLLYLNDGVWNGERILPEGWVQYTTTPAAATEKGEYGAQFWLNAGAKNNPADRYFPDVPTDLYWADGYEGQNVFILPSKELVVVKLSLSTGDYVDDNKFLAGIIDALPGVSP